ncbi:MAG: acyltransferase [Kiritimatiellae bacterium]|nr:acyltransferase [Kiritimatiellia bacterium]
MKLFFKITVQVILFVFPWQLRRVILCKMFKYEIDPSARVRCAIILAKKVSMEPLARIGNLVICKPIDFLKMGEDTSIGFATFITGIPGDHSYYYSHMRDRKCELIIDHGACITGRHYVDCSCGIYVGAFTTIAGLRSQLMTHSLDVYKCRQGGAAITIGKYCFLGTQCILLPGATLADYSILGAGSVVTNKLKEPCCMYAGVPACFKKKLEIDDIPWMHRTTSNAENKP